MLLYAFLDISKRHQVKGFYMKIRDILRLLATLMQIGQVLRQIDALLQVIVF